MNVSRKKEKGPTQARTDHAYATVDVDESGMLEVTFDLESDTFEVVGALPGTSKTVSVYQRVSGKDKVVSSTPSTGASAATAARALFGYDRVLAIDTNTKVIDDVPCSFCVAIQVVQSPSSYGAPGIPFSAFCGFVFVRVASSVNAERLGWHYVLRRYAEEYRLENERLAVLVDSALDAHVGINKREEPYFLGHLLPPNFTLVYASSDVGSDLLQGRLIHECDSTCNSIFRSLRESLLPDELPLNSNCEEFRALLELRMIPSNA